MLLSTLNEKNVFVNKISSGICLGIGFSLKNYSVKYLLCASVHTQNAVDFSVSTTAVTDVSDIGITLSRLRPVYPKNCAKVSIGLPIYSFEGGFLGRVEDLEIHNFVATRIYTDRGEIVPITSIFACSDAVILRKEQAYPLGQRIPTPLVSIISDKTDTLVTRAVLKNATAKKALIKLTLSLPPFNINPYDL